MEDEFTYELDWYVQNKINEMNEQLQDENNSDDE